MRGTATALLLLLTVTGCTEAPVRRAAPAPSGTSPAPVSPAASRRPLPPRTGVVAVVALTPDGFLQSDAALFAFQVGGAGDGTRLRLGPAVHASAKDATTGGLVAAGPAAGDDHAHRLSLVDGRLRDTRVGRTVYEGAVAYADGGLVYLNESATEVIAVRVDGRVVRRYPLAAERTPPRQLRDDQSGVAAFVRDAGGGVVVVQQANGGVQLAPLGAREPSLVVPGDNAVLSAASTADGDVYLLTDRLDGPVHLLHVAPDPYRVVSWVEVPLPEGVTNGLQVLATRSHGVVVFAHGSEESPYARLWRVGQDDRLVPVRGVTTDLGHVAGVGPRDEIWVYGSVGHNRVARVDLGTGRVERDVPELRSPRGSRVVAVVAL